MSRETRFQAHKFNLIANPGLADEADAVCGVDDVHRGVRESRGAAISAAEGSTGPGPSAVRCKQQLMLASMRRFEEDEDEDEDEGEETKTRTRYN